MQHGFTILFTYYRQKRTFHIQKDRWKNSSCQTTKNKSRSSTLNMEAFRWVQGIWETLKCNKQTFPISAISKWCHSITTKILPWINSNLTKCRSHNLWPYHLRWTHKLSNNSRMLTSHRTHNKFRWSVPKQFRPSLPVKWASYTNLRVINLWHSTWCQGKVWIRSKRLIPSKCLSNGAICHQM